MKIRLISEVEIADPNKLLDTARLVHFRETGEWSVPESLGEAVRLLLDAPAFSPDDCGFEIVANQTEEVAAEGRDQDSFCEVLEVWKKSRDFEAEERRFQAMVENLEALGDDAVLDDLIDDLVNAPSSDLNNEGLEGQLGCLLEVLGWEQTERKVGEIIQAAYLADDLEGPEPFPDQEDHSPH